MGKLAGNNIARPRRRTDKGKMMGGARMIYAGWALTVLSILFLLMDAGMKVVGATASVEATGALGFDTGQVRILGVILLVCTGLYAIPQTAPLGAILITGYLGGAIAVNFQHNAPLASHTLFGVYLGIVVWAGLLLRSPVLQALVPIIRQR
jgi:uncharacterized MnhB-related membrane protein